jgi:coenzyme F420-reducing hydrogenase gamma subunit
MSPRYELTYRSPVTVEDGAIMGDWLSRLAEEHAASITQTTSDRQRRLVADLFHIAADAFDSAAALVEGEAREEHYINLAYWLRRRAKIIVATLDCSV